jgi:hypothetical protein
MIQVVYDWPPAVLAGGMAVCFVIGGILFVRDH